jgi:16S rRNA (uracil1498-N3)-methyltransferase
MDRPPRLFVDAPPHRDDAPLTLPAGAARHVQVLRLQPGDAVTLFDGRGGEWVAQVVAIARQAVQVRVLDHNAREAELPIAVTLALAMPANDRMDSLIEKATELGAAAIAPLIAERSVLRLGGERAERRQAHWQAIAVAACEQCGRNRVPTIHAVRSLAAWFDGLADAAPAGSRLLLGWRNAAPWSKLAAQLGAAVTLLSGPEGGFTDAEEDLAARRGFQTVSLGPRVLRADTAPLAALAALALKTP